MVILPAYDCKLLLIIFRIALVIKSIKLDSDSQLLEIPLGIVRSQGISFLGSINFNSLVSINVGPTHTLSMHLDARH